MFHNLYFRFLAAFTIIIFIIVGSAFLFAYRATHSELSQVEAQLQAVQDRRVESELSRVFQIAHSWDAVQPFVVQMGNLYGRRIIITDTDGNVVVDSENLLIGNKYSGESSATLLSSVQPSGTGGFVSETVGTLYIIGEQTDINQAALQIAYNGIGRFFVLGGLLAVLAALVLTGILSRVILAPIRALTTAARKFGKGDFSHRVDCDNRTEIGELAASFNNMAENLENTEMQRRHMVADIAHELRTPLTNLRGYLEAISDGLVKPDEATIHSLSEEADTLSRLVADLQELSMADAGALKLIFDAVDAKEIVSDSVYGIQPKAASRSIELAVDFPDELPTVKADPYRLRQILNNLINNAVEHTPAHGTINVCANVRDNFMIFSVEDTGEGIPAEDLPRIFDRFYRVDKSRTRSTGGSGLGLTITKRLVEAHGGVIDVVSKPGQGTTFTFSIPLSNI